MIVVYKITRSDGLEYIGITCNKNHRFACHYKSKRFEMGIKQIEILKECSNYSKAEDLEEHYITLYDTFENGLNVTLNGKGRNKTDRFNTYGFVFSDESRRKMSEAAKRRGPNNRGHKHSDKTKELFSLKRKGRPAHNKKVDDVTIEEWISAYRNNTLQLDNNHEFISTFVKKSQKNQVGRVLLNELKTPNGKNITLEMLYSKYFSQKYNYSASLVREYLIGARQRCK